MKNYTIGSVGQKIDKQEITIIEKKKNSIKIVRNIFSFLIFVTCHMTKFNLPNLLILYKDQWTLPKVYCKGQRIFQLNFLKDYQAYLSSNIIKNVHYWSSKSMSSMKVDKNQQENPLPEKKILDMKGKFVFFP